MYEIKIGLLSLSIHIALGFLAILLAIISAIFFDRKLGSKSETKLWSLLITSALLGRVVYVAKHYEAYKGNIIGMLDIRDGGFALITAIAFFVLFTIITSWRHAKERKPLLFSAALGLSILGIGYATINLLNTSGQTIENIQLSDLNGQAIDTNSFLGKPSVINVWATWCPPCRREMPALQKSQQSNPNINFIFINQRESKQTVLTFLSEQQLNLENVLLDDQGLFASQINSNGLPTTVFLDAQGRVVSIRLGELSEATLNDRIKKIAPGNN